ncbi:glycosyltransferase family 4 protein [Candidatus Roizmanbacteria bacterium CG02_land_8_20_14_3_00_36_15]|nr:MAG: glycosyltransferase family 4 protein [Candidatus Roizmanbacteria bacterium CG02_land_8_20_14_3_00_36_15]
MYSPLRFITPLIWESFDFSKYDLVISSSGSWMSKGIKTNRPKDDRPMGEKPTIHISYVHHPPRYLYGYETAIEWQKYWPIKIYGNLINHHLRIWDYLSSQRADYFIANSEETKRRIQKFYRRNSTVIYPPVSIPQKLVNPLTDQLNNYFLTVSRLARAKHVDVLIQAANQAQFNLKIVGTGRDEKYLQSIAGPTVEFLGNLSDEELTKIYQNAKAFLFASVDEEFGIAPVEAMGWGLPVIAYRGGGIPEYVIDGENGFLFDRLDKSLLVKKVNELTSLSEKKYLEMRKQARKTAERFSKEKFRRKILNFINLKVKIQKAKVKNTSQN